MLPVTHVLAHLTQYIEAWNTHILDTTVSHCTYSRYEFKKNTYYQP